MGCWVRGVWGFGCGVCVVIRVVLFTDVGWVVSSVAKPYGAIPRALPTYLGRRGFGFGQCGGCFPHAALLISALTVGLSILNRATQHPKNTAQRERI